MNLRAGLVLLLHEEGFERHTGDLQRKGVVRGMRLHAKNAREIERIARAQEDKEEKNGEGRCEIRRRVG
jgi:hypothetical protein